MIAVIAALAFAVEAAIGFGSTVLVASIGAQLVPLDVLIPAFVPVNIVLSSLLAVRGRRTIAWRLLLVEIAPPVAVGVAAGIALRGVARLEPAFGAFVIVLALLQLARPHAVPRRARPVVYALAGIAHGMFGTGGPLVVYATRSRLADPRATYAVLWLVLNVALALSFTYTSQIVHTSLPILAALPVGFVVGQRLAGKLPPQIVWIVLLAAGCMLFR